MLEEENVPKISRQYILIGALIGALVGLLSTCGGEPAYASPVIDSWPIEVGDTVQVSTVCAETGAAKLRIAFDTDTSLELINFLYNLLLAKGDCVLVPGGVVPAEVVEVSDRILLQSGKHVLALTLKLSEDTPVVYTFIIVTTRPKKEIAA